ncbi:hypothetical protein D3C85_923050 [compost metagenome]
MQLAGGDEADRLDLVLDGRGVHVAGLAARNDVAAPALRAGDLDQVRIGIVQLAGEAGHAVAGQFEAQGVQGAIDVAAGAGVGLQDDVVALDLGVVEVQVERPVVIGDELGVPAQGRDVAVALVQVVADHALDVVPGAGDDHAVFNGVAGAQRRAGTADVRGQDIADGFAGIQERFGRSAPGQRELDAAQDLGVLELGIEGVDRRVEAIVRAPFQHAHIAVTLQLRRHDVGLDPAGQQVAVAVGRIAPGVETFRLIGRRHVGVAQGDADGVVRELVDIAQRIAAAVVGRARVQGADVVPLITGVGHDGATAVVQRTHGLHVHRAGQALTGQGGVGRLIDDDAGHQLRGELVEFDAAVIAGRHHFAPVQQGGGEVRAEAANGDLLAAAIEALHGHAGQAGQGFSDRDVGQLADVFGRDDFDDRGVAGLGRDRGLDRATDAGDDDLVDLGRLVVLRGGLRLGAARQSQGHDNAQGAAGHEARTPGEARSHRHPPMSVAL